MLSQNTSDINCERAYAAMRARYPRWEDVLAAASGASWWTVLRPGGLANQKAPRIQAILARAGGVAGTGSTWAGWPSCSRQAAMAFLTALPGVGAKTASCVLLFSLGMPVMPVDTHVHRIALRLGLIGPRVARRRRASAADRDHAARPDARGAPAADRARPPHLQGAAAAVRGVRAARPVSLRPAELSGAGQAGS